MRKKKKLSIEDIIIDSIVTVVLVVLTFACLYPLWYVLMASFSSDTGVTMAKGILFWPVDFQLKGYQMVFNHKLIMNGYGVTLKKLALGLPLNLSMTLACGYFMSCKGMFFKKPLVALFLFNMYFSGGMIPSYLNIKDLGLYNTIWAIVLPGAMGMYNAIICKTSIESIPESLKESAYIDGANDLQIIYKIIAPLIKPTMAVLTLYYGVAHWSAWFQASIYIKDNNKLPLQNILRSILIQGSALGMEDAMVDEYKEAIKYAAIVISTVPILCIYPFLQKYFAKGVMIGAVKG